VVYAIVNILTQSPFSAVREEEEKEEYLFANGITCSLRK